MSDTKKAILKLASAVDLLASVRPTEGSTEGAATAAMALVWEARAALTEPVAVEAPVEVPEAPEWVVNSLGELGVKVGGRFYFLYKGESLTYKTPLNDGQPMYWRPVKKREFGEVCRPPVPISLDDSPNWEPLPEAT